MTKQLFLLMMLIFLSVLLKYFVYIFLGHPVYIRECGSIPYVGLTGTFQTLIQKSTRMVPPFLRIFFYVGLKWSSGYMGATMYGEYTSLLLLQVHHLLVFFEASVNF